MMLELMNRPPRAAADLAAAQLALAAFKPGAALLGGLAAAMLNEIDYPILLVAGNLRLMFANKTAQGRLREGRPLLAEAGQLRAAASAGQSQLRRAVEAATQRGLRSLVVLDTGVARATAAAVVPMPGEEGAALLMLAKSGICQELSMHCYAREQALTPGETVVLRGLCGGETPEAIARRRGVALSTVRSQIGSLRAKTGAKDIGALVRTVAMLPPLVNALLAA
jgi:DNA-binding CsgD family transcriptional regulator